MNNSIVKSTHWILIFRQTHPFYVDDWASVNPDDPLNENYSILNTIDDSYRLPDGKLYFKIV